MKNPSIDFLRWWAPDGPWTLTAIHPSQKAIDTRTLATLEAVEAWLGEYGKDRNVYFAVNPLRHPVLRKAGREDVAALGWIHVDVDPRVGEDFDAERARILAMLQNPPAGVPPASAIVDSGGGYQAFWRLKDPLQLDGRLDAVEDAARYNQQVELLLGADACHNVDRIMRLPGTTNWPDARKKKRGRKPAKAAVVERHDDRTFALATFTKAAKVQSDGGFTGNLVKVSGNVERVASVDDLPVNEYAKVVIVQGHDPENPSKWSSRSEALFYACCEMVRAGCSDDVIYSVITDPGFGISESVRDKGAAAERYALKQIESAREHAIDPELRELNDKHAVVNVGGKCRIIREEPDRIGGHRRSILTFQSFADFCHFYGNRRKEFVTPKGSTTSVPLGTWWTTHQNRRTYDSIVFAPEQDVPGAYNLWRGFAFDARPGDCSKFLAHVRENVCSDSDELFDYVVGWMATAVQHPARQGHTAVVLRGRQGTGKSFFVKAFGRLFGRHFLHVSDPKHLVGAFNAHLRDCVVLFGDEAFYAGDKKHESVLKMLVTESQITIEAKGVDAEASPNFVHLLMASNEEWVVPAGESERRFLVLDVGDAMMQDSGYFGAIEAELTSGGYEALLHFLMSRDLTGFDVRRIPRTKALQEQKVFSLKPEQEWWYNKLRHGEITDGAGWPKFVHSSHLGFDYTTYARAWNVSARGNSTKLGRFLATVVPDGFNLRGQLSGKHDVVTESGELRSVERPRIYHLPALSICRRHWDRRFGGPYDWSEPAEVDAQESVDEEPF